jgi:hypothetical protein
MPPKLQRSRIPRRPAFSPRICNPAQIRSPRPHRQTMGLPNRHRRHLSARHQTLRSRFRRSISIPIRLVHHQQLARTLIRALHQQLSQQDIFNIQLPLLLLQSTQVIRLILQRSHFPPSSLTPRRLFLRGPRRQVTQGRQPPRTNNRPFLRHPLRVPQRLHIRRQPFLPSRPSCRLRQILPVRHMPARFRRPSHPLFRPCPQSPHHRLSHTLIGRKHLSLADTLGRAGALESLLTQYSARTR